MKSRKAIALFGLSAFALITGIFLYLTRIGPEPVYEGKNLGLWLDALAVPVPKQWGVVIRTTRSPQQQEHARTALKKIGPQAIPFIVRKLNQNDSPWRNKYREIWPHLPAVLKKLRKPAPINYGVMDAANAFLAIGTDAIPQLLPKLHASNPAVREAAIYALFRFPENPIPTNQMVLICKNALADPDVWVRGCAIEEIEKIGLAASNTIPALIAALQNSEMSRFQRPFPIRMDASRALAKMGPLAADAVPVLTNILSQRVSGSLSRVSAASALWYISSNKDLVLPVLTNGLVPTAFSSFQMRQPDQFVIQTLGDMGPQAKEAFPALVETLKKSTSDIRFALKDALMKIDPVAGAKALEENPQNYNP